MFSTFIQKMINNEKVFVLFIVVMLMAVMAWEKQSGKPVESEFL